jgi:hypothetical protein
MWVDKDDVFAEDKVREFKASNPEAEIHIRTSIVTKSPHPHPLTRSQLLYNHASHYMSSDGNNDLAQEYSAGATADSPIPFLQEFPVNTPDTVHAPIPIIDFTTLRALSPVASTFVPRPITASSSASDIAAMFRQLQVHTPTPLTPDGQRAAEQAAETFAVSYTPAEGRGGQTGAGLESGAVTRPEATLGAPSATTNISQAPSYDSATDDDLRHCARCGEQCQYCHRHTPVLPNPSLDLPPAQSRAPVSGSIPAHRVARVNLNRAQATALAANLINALENNQDSGAVPPAYDYGEEITHILAEGLGLDQVVVAEGLGVRGRGGQRGGQGQGGRPMQVPDARRPANLPQTPTSRNRRHPATRPVLPTPPGFEHNRGPAYIPFRIQENGHKMPVRYIQARLNAPNPFVEGRLSLNGPTYHSEIHAASVHDVDIPPPPITAELLRLLQLDYMGHDCMDEVLGELGDRSLIAEVNCYRRLERKRRSHQESITRLEDQLFTMDVERHMCVSRLEGARALVRIQGEMQRSMQAFRLSPWSVERGHLP